LREHYATHGGLVPELPSTDAPQLAPIGADDPFRRIFERAPVAVAMIDSPTGRFVRVNDRYCDLLARSREELLRLRWQDVTHPDDLEGDLAAYQEMLVGAAPGYVREKRFRRPDGATRWIEISLSRLWEPGEPPSFHVVVAADITARKLEGLALRESEERYRGLLEKIGDVVFTTSVDGVVTSANRAVENFGWTPADVIGRPLSALIHPDDLPMLMRTRRDSMDGVAQGAIEYRVIDTWGTPRPVRSASMPLIEQGAPRGMFGVVVDLTRQRDTEERLRQAQRMEAVGRLAGGVAHDFNNLLSVIESYAEIALESVRPGDPLHEPLAEIREAGRRAEALTRQLLAFGRKQVLRPERLDVAELVARLEKMLRRLLGEDVELTFARAPTPMIVEADPGQLEQVLMNLAINARDAMPGGGRLSIAVSAVSAGDAGIAEDTEPRAPPPASYVAIEVSDTGHGMDEATCARIFEPFFTTKAPGKGTGLGLATVYGIVRQSGGHVRVKSAPGRGTTFRILLPAPPQIAPQAPSKESDRAPASGGRETLLLVEDEPAVRAIALRILEGAGYRVLVASSGAEAIGLAARHEGPIDLLVSDVVMPGMNGRQLADELLRVRRGLRVLFMSGYAEAALGDRGLAQGTEGLLDKPFTRDTLTRTVRAVLDGR
jgi:PAS domain S-box-containing protein